MRVTAILTLFALLTACGGFSSPDPADSSEGMSGTGNSTAETLEGTTTTSGTNGSETYEEPSSTVPCFAGADIQVAIGAASNGDTVLVCAGTHAVQLYVDRNITLDVEDSALLTTIDAGGLGPAITVGADRSITVRNLEITGGMGYPYAAGGIEATEGAELVVESCDVHDNQGMVGGIQGPYDGDTEITGSLVRDNIGDYAGGVGIGTGLLTSTEISNNHATLRGGGLWIYPFQGPVNSDVLVTRNSTDGLGGGIALDWASHWVGGVIEDNTAVEGGGIGLISASSVGVSGTLVQNNTATLTGGGLSNGLTIGGAMSIADTVFSGNSAPIGGAAFIQQTTDGNSSVDFTDVTIDGNQADEGAGIALSDIHLSITDGALIGNLANLAGGGLSLTMGASVTATNLDVGAVATTNTPEDVDLDGVAYQYDGIVTFSCAATCY